VTSSGIESATVRLSLLPEKPRYRELGTYPKYYAFTLLLLIKEDLSYFQTLKNKEDGEDF
jgi:hypothetical protein